MVRAYDASFEKYDIESGHFILEDKLPDETRARLEAAGVSVHELFYKEATLDNENTVRIFKNRSEVNKADVLEGRLPESKGEIAADRLYLENNGLAIGDELAGLKITGAVALSDYSALFKNNTDMMLDANKFCVAVVTPGTFDEIDENVHLCYAWLNNDKTLSDEQCRDKSDELGDILAADCGISDIVERSENQAISFTGEDMGGDKAMMTTLLYVVIVILGFVFAITTRSTIEQESGTVGTLLAEQSGRRFFDLDAEIAARSGRTAAEWIRTRGEDAFRAYESEVCASLAAESGAVIACGGGTVTRSENMRRLCRNGTVICLTRPLDALATADRPLSADGVAHLYKARRPLYEAYADLTVENDGDPAQTAREILARVRNRKEPL